MAKVDVNNVTLEYPIYNASAMSLRNTLVSLGTGGTLSKDASSNIVVVKALDNVSFSLQDGDRVGLVGHNGAGKSTLLRSVAGIYKPSAGEVKIEGSLATIFQLGAGLDPDLTGYENIIRMAMFLGSGKAEAKRMIPDIEAFTDLGNFLSVPVHAYSAGMLTRLSFGVATAVDPDILLIDEIIGAGDAEFQEKAKRRIEAIIRSARILVLASHSSSMINLYCNRILKFEHGRLIEDKRLPSAT